MSNEIGSKSFLLMRGTPALPGQVLESWGRPGEDFRSHRKIGRRGDEAEIGTVAIVADAVSAEVEIQEQKALQGQSVTIVDSFGNEHKTCKIHLVAPRPKLVLFEGSQQVMIRTRWLIEQGDPDV